MGSDGLWSRPCSILVRYSTLILARAANSERRSPGARRRSCAGSPRSSGRVLSRLARMKSPNGLPMPPAYDPISRPGRVQGGPLGASLRPVWLVRRARRTVDGMNDKSRLAVIVGSVREGRFGPVVAAWVADHARAHGGFEVD